MPKQKQENLKRLLKEVIVLIVGKHAEDIADLLESDKYINEFIIAKKLGITINQTRNILYKITDHGLVSSIRKKDKRKGWYTYFWKIEILKVLEFLKTLLLKNVDQLINQIKSRETKQFYVCKSCNVEFNEENALLKNFICSECGNVFSLKDNSSIIKELKKNLAKINRELEFIDEEINIEIERINKKVEKEKNKKLKEIQKETKRKKAQKLAEKMANKKLMKKDNSSKKKIIKKKKKPEKKQKMNKKKSMKKSLKKNKKKKK